MKKLTSYITIACAALAALSSCNPAALEKKEVEAGFAARQGVPSVVLNTTDYTFDNVEGIATVTATFSGITSAMDSVELGFLSTTDETFYDSKSIVLGQKSDGTYSASVLITAGKTNYIMATASSLGGTAYSEVLAIDVPDIEWYKKLQRLGNGFTKFYAPVTDFWGDEYNSTISVCFNPEDNTVIFHYVDAYFAKYNLDTQLVGYADIEDTDNPTVNFTLDENGFVPYSGPASEQYGLYMLPLDEEGEVASEFTITFNKEMNSMTMHGFGLYEIGAGFWSAWPPATYAVQ